MAVSAEETQEEDERGETVDPRGTHILVKGTY